MSNLFVELGLGNEVDDLPFPKAEARVKRTVVRLRTAAGWTNSASAILAEFLPASETASHEIQGPQFKGGHDMITLLFRIYRHTCEKLGRVI